MYAIVTFHQNDFITLISNVCYILFNHASAQQKYNIVLHIT